MSTSARRWATSVGVVPWRYHAIIIPNTSSPGAIASQFNSLGADGWELVSFAPRVKSVVGGLSGGDLIAVFKQPGLGAFDPGDDVPY